MMQANFPIVIEREASRAFSAFVPGLPVYAAADALAKVSSAIRDVLTAYLEEHPDASTTAQLRLAAATTHHSRVQVKIRGTAALLGGTKSIAKTLAVRANGRLGGRPAKFSAGTKVEAVEAARAAVRGRTGTVVGRGKGRSTFEVAFGSARHQLPSWHLRRSK